MADAAASTPPAPGAAIAETPAAGLTSAQVAELRSRGLANAGGERTSRSVAEILRANILTRFNFILGVLLAAILVAGQPQDALFGIVLVTNALIGIAQELRAKRTLDRLAVLSAPRVRVIRDGAPQDIAVADLVAGDLVDLRAGDQLVADGVVRASVSLEADESLLTGESEPVGKRAGDRLLSGSFVVAGSGGYQATGVGADAYARKLAAQARRFALVRSELMDGINRILRYVTWAIGPVAVLLVISGWHAHRNVRQVASGTVAALVGMVPQGLVLLASVAFGVAAVTLARRRVLVQQLSRGRGPGPGGRGVPGQDRHPHRRHHRLRQPHPARGPGAGRGGTRGSGRRREPQRDAGRRRAGLPAAGGVAAAGSRAVLLGAQVERGQLRRPGHLGAGSTGDGAAGRPAGTAVAGRRAGRQRTAGPGAGTRRGPAGRRVAPAGLAGGGLRPARRAAQVRRRRDHRVLRGAGRGAEGDLRG